MKYKNRDIKFRFLTTIAAAILVGEIGLSTLGKPPKKELVKLPSHVRERICEEYKLPGNGIVDEDNKIDERFTTDLVNKIDTLDLSILYLDDLEFLKNFKGLKSLRLEFSHLLTDEDIEIINSLNLDEVVLKMSFLESDIAGIKDINYSKINNVKFDVDTLHYENEKIALLDKYRDIMQRSITKEEFDKLDKLNAWLDDLLVDIKIDENDTEKEKIYKISKYICTRLTYDFSNDEIEKDTKVEYYNEHAISSLMEQHEKDEDDGEFKLNIRYYESDTNGICINYAALFANLCVKNDIDCIIKIGVTPTGDHAWNRIKFKNGEIKYVDLTSFDASSDLTFLLSYTNDEDKEIRSLARKGTDMFLFIDEEVFNKNSIQDANREVLYDFERFGFTTYYNENHNETKDNGPSNDLIYLSSLLAGSLIGYGAASYIDNSDNKELVLKPNNKKR